ncbi:MAG: hypothetical protein ACLPG5_02095 [Acidocella sp.]
MPLPLSNGLTGQARIIALRKGGVPASNAAHEKFYVEDGWVFREHHGKYVECICRSEDLSTTPVQPLPVNQMA